MINRRQFSQGCSALAAMSLGGLSLGGCTPATERLGRGAPTSFPQLKQVDAGLLNVGYAESGPVDGPAVVLLHGWPYDIHSYVEVAPLLASAGYRVITPFLRGFGSTTFLSGGTARNAQQSAVACDVLALMNALHIPKAIMAGFDWGSRTASAMAVLWPERCTALVAVSGYLVSNPGVQMQPLPPVIEYGWWYQYYFATERGELGYSRNRNEFNRLIWRNASPRWNFDEATFDRTAASFANADHVKIVIHNYRWRLGLAPGEPRYDALEQRLVEAAGITVPAITIASDFDGAAIGGESYRSKFLGPYSHRVFPGVGHNVPQETPRQFAQAVMDVGHQ